MVKWEDWVGFIGWSIIEFKEVDNIRGCESVKKEDEMIIIIIL